MSNVMTSTGTQGLLAIALIFWLQRRQPGVGEPNYIPPTNPNPNNNNNRTGGRLGGAVPGRSGLSTSSTQGGPPSRPTSGLAGRKGGGRLTPGPANTPQESKKPE